MEASKIARNDGASSEAERVLGRLYRMKDEKPSLRRRLRGLWAQTALELSEVHWAVLLVNALFEPILRTVGRRLRTVVYRMIGFRIGRGTVMNKGMQFIGVGKPYSRLTIGKDCLIGAAVFNLNAPVRIGDGVVISGGTVISTDKHDIGPPEHRMGHIKSHPLTIGDGAWIARNSVVLANVGAGAIVALGAIVIKDVPPNTIVGGVPARVLRELPTDAGIEEAKESRTER